MIRKICEYSFNILIYIHVQERPFPVNVKSSLLKIHPGIQYSCENLYSDYEADVSAKSGIRKVIGENQVGDLSGNMRLCIVDIGRDFGTLKL